MRLIAALCSATLAIAACADAGTSPSDTGAGVEVTLAALSLSNVTYTQYTITVEDSANNLVSTVQIDSDSYQVGTDPSVVRYVAPCDSSDTGNAIVTVSVDAITTGSSSVPSGSLPPAQIQNVDCVPDQSVQVDFDFYALASSQLGFFDIVVGTNLVYCSAKLDCETSASTFFPASADGGVVLGFACTADNTTTADTVLHLDNIVVDCGSPNIATITPDQAGNLPAGKISDAATPLIDTVTVFRGEDLIGSTSDNVYWNVAIGLTDAATALTCTLTTDGAVSAGNTVVPDSPFIAWSVQIANATAEPSCGEQPLFGVGSGVTVEWPATQGTAESFDNLYTGNPTAFVTTATYLPQTHFTGLGGADTLCGTLATTAGLPGTFVAWMSDSATDAKSRISGDAIRLVNGDRVALGRTDLLDSDLAFAIDIDQAGTTGITGAVWTGTLADGTKDTDNCSDWGTNLVGTSGTVGNAATTDGTWTDDGTATCDTPAHLICIQVP